MNVPYTYTIMNINNWSSIWSQSYLNLSKPTTCDLGHGIPLNLVVDLRRNVTPLHHSAIDIILSKMEAGSMTTPGDDTHPGPGGSAHGRAGKNWSLSPSRSLIH